MCFQGAFGFLYMEAEELPKDLRECENCSVLIRDFSWALWGHAVDKHLFGNHLSLSLVRKTGTKEYLRGKTVEEEGCIPSLQKWKLKTFGGKHKFNAFWRVWVPDGDLAQKQCEHSLGLGGKAGQPGASLLFWPRFFSSFPATLLESDPQVQYLFPSPHPSTYTSWWL